MGRSRSNKGRDIDGIIILDKPLEITSHVALQKVKRLYNANKAGHTGSLDRMATGLLPICLGEATKFSSFLLESHKRYIAEAKLGIKTNTADAEGQVIQQKQIPIITEPLLHDAIKPFRGEYQQTPPMFSALKVNGKPLYERAYRGEEIDRKARPVTIYELDLISYTEDTFIINVECSKGTYIRTLVEDIGDTIGCGAHVSALRRLAAGPFQKHDMVTLMELEQLSATSIESLDRLLWQPDKAVMHLPKVKLEASVARKLVQGQPVRVPKMPSSGLVRLYDHETCFLGTGTILDDGQIVAKRLLKVQVEQ